MSKFATPESLKEVMKWMSKSNHPFCPDANEIGLFLDRMKKTWENRTFSIEAQITNVIEEKDTDLPKEGSLVINEGFKSHPLLPILKE